MKDVKTLGLVKYFHEVIDFNNFDRITKPYDHAYLLSLGWSDQEISKAKAIALIEYFKALIDTNPLHQQTGTRYNRKKLLNMGWNEKEIDAAAKNVSKPNLGKIIIGMVIVAGILALLIKSLS